MPNFRVAMQFDNAPAMNSMPFSPMWFTEKKKIGVVRYATGILRIPYLQ
jgi:hypothetical protein